MAPLRADPSVSRLHSAKVIISVCSSSFLTPTVSIFPPSSIYSLHHFSFIFYPSFSHSSSLFSPLVVLFLPVSPSAMRPCCQAWLFWFECSTCGWNLRPAALPSHRPRNGAVAQENKPLFLVQSVDGWIDWGKEGAVTEFKKRKKKLTLAEHSPWGQRGAP